MSSWQVYTVIFPQSDRQPFIWINVHCRGWGEWHLNFSRFLSELTFTPRDLALGNQTCSLSGRVREYRDQVINGPYLADSPTPVIIFPISECTIEMDICDSWQNPYVLDPWDKSYHSKEYLGRLWKLPYPLSQDIKSKVIFNFPFCHSWGNGRDECYL